MSDGTRRGNFHRYLYYILMFVSLQQHLICAKIIHIVIKIVLVNHFSAMYF